MIHDACDDHGMNGFAFLQVDRERALLIDHIGACERIIMAPLPRAYCIKIRRFTAKFLITDLSSAAIERLP